MSYTGGNAARVGDPCPIVGCGKKLRNEPRRGAEIHLVPKSLVCKRGHHIVNLDAPKAEARGKADG